LEKDDPTNEPRIATKSRNNCRQYVCDTRHCHRAYQKGRRCCDAVEVGSDAQTEPHVLIYSNEARAQLGTIAHVNGRGSSNTRYRARRILFPTNVVDLAGKAALPIHPGSSTANSFIVLRFGDYRDGSYESSALGSRVPRAEKAEDRKNLTEVM
jgi:hypothetical protein